MAKYWFSVVAFAVLALMVYGGWVLTRWLFMDEIETKKARKRSAKMPPCCYCERYDGKQCVTPERNEIDGTTIVKPCREVRGTKKCRPRFKEVRDDMPDNDRK